MKKILIIITILITAVLVNAQQVIRPAGLTGSLRSQFEKAFQNYKGDKSFWIGYSIARSDSRDITIGTFYYDDDMDYSLRDIIMNNSNPVKNKSNKKRPGIHSRSMHISRGFSINDNDKPDGETAILFLYDPASKKISEVEDIGICNLSHNYDLNGRRLIWLGKQDNRESLDFVMGLYKENSSPDIKRNLTGGIAIHTGQPSVTPFLVNIINDNTIDKQRRKDAAFWLGMQDNNTALSVLKNIAENDPDYELRKSAVFGIGFMNLPGTIDLLVSIARHSDSREVRKSAVYAIGNKAVKKAEEALQDFIENAPDIEIKKAAVYALASTSKDSVPFLINIAKNNSNLEIRKCAIYSLSNSDDARAINALIELAKN